MLQNKIYQLNTPRRGISRSESIKKKLFKLNLDSLKTHETETQMNSDLLTTSRAHHYKSISSTLFQRRNSKYPAILQQLQQQYSTAFKNKELDKAIDAVVDVMILHVVRDNILGLLNTYILVAETYLKFTYYSSAIQTYTQLLHLCDICNDVEEVQKSFRLKVLLKLSIIAHNLKMHETAVKILKKLLQYSWHFKDKYLEVVCFDKLGQEAYLQANLEKAQFYHCRAIWGRSEPENSNHYQISTQNIGQYLKKLPKGIQHIDQNLVSKATFLPFTFISQTQNQQNNNNSSQQYCGIEVTNYYLKNMNVIKQPHRFLSHVTPEACFQKLFITSQFEFEISTPRQAKQDSHSNDLLRINPQDLFISVLQNSNDREEILYMNKVKQQNKMGGFIPPSSYRIQKKDQPKIDKKLLKQPLIKMINERLTSQPNFTEIIEERYRAARMNHSRVPLKDQVRISHLSPNRDLLNYGECLQATADPDQMFISNVLF
ncbi:unnamed protein product (macronuclear) [Paramecium tetraurelia]|uniref:Uncharacterized protein n=1 Tax=Paramecium tetraurelia TaxID=5888 RepID=A0DR35_PARTE|nr:uncharacterized protein GSPATT00002903001 [Paramecium tetraurelia]CAK85502.1 unnamed protein product [Paramecium tetraurelia]|eukprot:XP_001452899.1 hypothetical protein (macronuclear) [Paramecium tetraurelia strain d4-2]